jgi:soluble lytic murein transglycosylase
MRESFLANLKRSSPLLFSMGLSGLVVVGSLFALSKFWPQAEPPIPEVTNNTNNVEPEFRPASRIAAYSFQPPAVRRSALEALAKQGNPTEQPQARYVLAADEVREGNGTKALQWLDGLEDRYKLLTSDIWVLRANAYTLDRKLDRAQKTWKQIIEKFPQSAAAGEAYYTLGKKDPQYWNRAIATLPAHPRSVEIAVQRLQKNPNDRGLLLLVAQYGLHLKDYTTYLDRLTQKLGPQLKPQEWQTIAFGYWEKLKYKEAGLAYSHTPTTSRNAYRVGRGLQLGNEDKAAMTAYQRTIAAFPKAPETPRALMKLADLTDDRATAIAYLDKAIPLAEQLKRPEDVGDALRRKAQRLQKLNPAQQIATETQLLEKFAQTESAAELRWKKAWTAAKTQQIDTAKQWALALAQANPDSEYAPKALFWAGKWAERLGNPQERQQHFTDLWQRYPQSYYSWRAATLSGQPVGDFQTIRAQKPTLEIPTSRLPLGAGSPTVRELYALGEGRSAWANWLLEFKDRENPSIPEQLTDGVLRLAVGEYLDGLFMLDNLRDRTLTEPEQQSQRAVVQALRQNPLYWQTLYPIPYWPDIQKWSAQHALNPVMVLALIRQESRFEPAIQSVAGAKGLMQLMPETAAEIAAKLKFKPNLEDSNDNIRLGTWYLDSTHDTYQDNSMLAIASYNAGPGNVAQWIETLDTRDADIFVETIPFDETQTYVKSVLENYWNYLRLYNAPLSRTVFSKSVSSPRTP